MPESVAVAASRHPYRRMLRYAAGQWRRLAWILGLTGVGAVLAAAQPLPLLLLADHACGGLPTPELLRSGLELVGLPDQPATLVIVTAVLALAMYIAGSVLGAALSWLARFFCRRCWTRAWERRRCATCMPAPWAAPGPTPGTAISHGRKTPVIRMPCRAQSFVWQA